MPIKPSRTIVLEKIGDFSTISNAIPDATAVVDKTIEYFVNCCKLIVDIFNLIKNNYYNLIYYNLIYYNLIYYNFLK